MCQWNYPDCAYEGSAVKCDVCFTAGLLYKEKKAKIKKTLAKHQNKADGRMGSSFEYKNHRTNQEVLSDNITVGMTLNSGATVLEKGDEQIRGLINIMEEDKTRVIEQTKGKETFTIQKKWLEKLHREALAENMEFWDLKFSFREMDKDVYTIMEQEVFYSMIKTIVSDRRKVKVLEKKKDIAEKELALIKAENSELVNKIALLESQLEYERYTKKIDEDENYL